MKQDWVMVVGVVAGLVVVSGSVLMMATAWAGASVPAFRVLEVVMFAGMVGTVAGLRQLKGGR